MAWQSYLKKHAAAACGAPIIRRTCSSGVRSSSSRNTAMRGEMSAVRPMGRPLELYGVKRTCRKFKGAVSSQKTKPKKICVSRYQGAKSTPSICARKRAACTAWNQSIAKGARRLAPGKRLSQTKAHLPRATDCLGMVGASQEPDYAHAERHPPAQLDRWAKVCARCCYLRWAKEKRLQAWLAPKPSFLPGAWGLGCTYCAAGRHSGRVQEMRSVHILDNKDAGRCKQAISRASGWSVYEKRCFHSAKQLAFNIDQHARGDMHRLCANVFNSSKGHFDYSADPRGVGSTRNLHHVAHVQDDRVSSNKWSEERPVAMSDDGLVEPSACSEGSPLLVAREAFISKVGSVADPFRGKVPQCDDWLTVWAEYTSAISIQG